MGGSVAQPDLVFDVGLHDGRDTSYYLDRGYKVVGVDAREDAIQMAEKTFASAVRGGRLTLVHAAVVASGAPATTPFYISVQSSWSSLVESIAGRDGLQTQRIEVPTTSVSSLLTRFATPYYLKIDIEGADETALEDLLRTDARPTFVSVEAESADDAGTTEREALRKLELLAELGYHRFKLVDQDSLRVLSRDDHALGPRRDVVSRIRRKLFQRDGPRVHVLRVGGRRTMFALGATGPFGDDLAGAWLDAAQAHELLITARRAYFERDDARVHGFWCDWHAAR
jgi:FkbM family methyltransferase